MSLQTRLLRLSVPNALANITVPLAGLVDVAMLGHLDEVQHLAGVGLATILFDYAYWSFGFLKMGTQGLTAQAVGRDDRREIELVLLRSLLVAVAIALMLVASQTAIRTLGFLVLAGAPEVEAAGSAYFDARIWGALAVLPNFVFIGWFLGRERSGYVLVMTAVAAATNIVLDYVFIYRLQMDSRGAGLATMLSQFAMLATALVLLRSSVPAPGRDPRSPRRRPGLRELLDRRAVARLLTLNRDIMLRTFCLITTFAAFTNASAMLGTLVLAANAILLKILEVSAYFIDGISFATQSLAGILKGRRDAAGLRHLLRLSMIWGEALAMTVIGGLALFPDQLYGLLTSHADLIAIVRRHDNWLYATLAVGAIAYIYDGFFIGLTEGRILRNAMAISTLACFAPVAALAIHLGSSQLLWLAMLVFMAARVATLGSRCHAAIAGV